MRVQDKAVSADVLQQAIGWQMRDGSGNPEDRDEQAFHTWLNAHPDHARVWQQLGMIDDQLAVARGSAIRSTLALQNKRGAGKRATSMTLAGLAIMCALGVWHQYQPLPDLLAYAHTAVGERKRVVLPDQTVVHLNTRTAIDLAFNGEQRGLRILRGEVEIETAHTNPSENRPFVVTTKDGSMRALGTRFVVRQMGDEGTALSVTQSAVLAWPANCGQNAARCEATRRIEQGQQVVLRQNDLSDTALADAQVDAWKDGMLVVENMRLDDVVHELARYRLGYVRVAPKVANLKVTGTFSLRNSDLALSSLVAVLPVKLHTRTRYWVEFQPL